MARDKTSLDHYSPIHPAKRMKIKRISGRVERYDPYTEQKNDAEVRIHPSRNTNFRPRSTSRPNGLRRHGRKPSKPSRTNTTTPSNTPSISTAIHTKKERTSNPSTRIASLRKLLAHPTATTNLPPGARIEKERELAGLIFEQQKEKLARNRAAMIGRYHRVRFFERKKAERKLKRVIKERDGMVSGGDMGVGVGVEGDPEGEEERMRKEKERERKIRMLNAQVRNARVDLAYTIFSPLTEKYIGLFADDPGDERFNGKIENHKKDLAEGLSERDEKLLSQEQKEQLHVMREQEMQVVRMADKTGRVKPPGWYVVEAIMYPNGKSKHRANLNTHKTHNIHTNTKQQKANLDGTQEPDIESITNEFFFYDDGTKQDKDDQDTEDPLTKPHIKKHLDLLRESRLSSSKDADGDTVVTGESRADVELRRFGAVSLHAREPEAVASGPSRTGDGGKHGKTKTKTNTNVSRKRTRPTWLDEDEDAIHPNELDSSSSEVEFDDEDDNDVRGVRINQTRDGNSGSGSESESDGAGGFFER